jgi:hypothetical protein
MRRPSLLALALAVGATALSAPSAATAATGACAPETGDWCTSVTKTDGRRSLQLTTFSFRGSVKICVRGPRQRTCRSARLRRTKDGVYRARLTWATSFPDQGAGRYRVTFEPSVTGDQLGPTLSFTER